jgi:hypothetical protein
MAGACGITLRFWPQFGSDCQLFCGDVGVPPGQDLGSRPPFDIAFIIVMTKIAQI